MRLLLDTHTLIWAVDDPSKLGHAAASILEDPKNELLLSSQCRYDLGNQYQGGDWKIVSIPYSTSVVGTSDE